MQSTANQDKGQDSVAQQGRGVAHADVRLMRIDETAVLETAIVVVATKSDIIVRYVQVVERTRPRRLRQEVAKAFKAEAMSTSRVDRDLKGVKTSTLSLRSSPVSAW